MKHTIYSKCGLIFFTLLLSTFIISQAEAATILVKPDGTGDQPTIQAAVDAAQPGDTILLAAGVFTGQGNRHVYRPDLHNITIQGAGMSGPGKTEINLEGFAGKGFHLNRNNNWSLQDFCIHGGTWTGGDWDTEDDAHIAMQYCNNIIIRRVEGYGFHAGNGANPCSLSILWGNDHITIEDCHLYNNGDSAAGNRSGNSRNIMILYGKTLPYGSETPATTNVLIRNNVLHNSGSGIGDKRGAKTHDQPCGEYYNNIIYDVHDGMIINGGHMQIHHNVIYDASANGIVIGGYFYNPGVYTPEPHIYHNTLANCGTGLMFAFNNEAIDPEHPSENRWFGLGAEVKDNIMYHCNTNADCKILSFFYAAPYGIFDFDIDYNLYFDPDPLMVTWPNHAPMTLSGWKDFTAQNYVMQDVNSLWANPLFVNEAAGDFHLAEGSPAIGAGSDGSDLGALQYGEDEPVYTGTATLTLTPSTIVQHSPDPVIMTAVFENTSDIEGDFELSVDIYKNGNKIKEDFKKTTAEVAANSSITRNVAFLASAAAGDYLFVLEVKPVGQPDVIVVSAEALLTLINP